MISKEAFCKALQMIQEQSETDAKFSRVLDLVGDGHFIFGVKNKYFEALMLILKEAMNDKYEYIDWWLYEATPDYKVWTEDMKKEWFLKEPEALYDFIRDECHE